MINPMIAAMANTAATGELQNVQVGGRLRIRDSYQVPPLRVNVGVVKAALDRIATYKIGDGREALLELEELVRQSQYNDEDRTAVAKLLGDSLAGNASRDAKDFACRQLWIIGTSAEIPALANALKDPSLSNMARYALQNIEDSADVDHALIAALDGTDPSVQVGCINSLAMRKSDGVLDAIKPLRKSKDKDVAAAAKHAIGRLEGKIVP